MKQLIEKYQALKAQAKELMLAGQISEYLLSLQKVQAAKKEIVAYEAAA